MKRNTIRVGGMLAVLLAFGLLLAGCGKKDSGGGAGSGGSGGGAVTSGGGSSGKASKSSGKASPEGDFSVRLTEAGDGVVITDYTGSGGNVVIPAVIQGMPVHKIGYAFKERGSITSVTIPKGVTEIFGRAFQDCGNLASVTIPDSVTEIGYYAFWGCGSLASVTIPDSVMKIGQQAFWDCTSLVTVTVSPVAGRKSDSFVFGNCRKLSLASQAAIKAAGL